MNYENEFQELMIDSFKNQYGIIDETVLYHYLVVRLFIHRAGKEIKKNRFAYEFMIFLYEELHLPEGEVFFYRGMEFKKAIAIENSLMNIVENWIFENSIQYVVDEQGNKNTMDLYIQCLQEKIEKAAINKSKLYKNTKHYEWHWKYHALKKLNSMYNVIPIYPVKIQGILYPIHHESLRRTMEERTEALVHANEHQRSDVCTITEQDLEVYIYQNLTLIEEGLIYIDRQVYIVDGRIDILAKDKHGTFCIIELKVSEDKDLIWQCMYYPMQIKKKFGVSQVRMITIAYSYSQSILLPLQLLKHVEIMFFKPRVQMGKIKSLTIHPLAGELVA